MKNKASSSTAAQAQTGFSAWVNGRQDPAFTNFLNFVREKDHLYPESNTPQVMMAGEILPGTYVVLPADPGLAQATGIRGGATLVVCAVHNNGEQVFLDLGAFVMACPPTAPVLTVSAPLSNQEAVDPPIRVFLPRSVGSLKTPAYWTMTLGLTNSRGKPSESAEMAPVLERLTSDPEKFNRLRRQLGRCGNGQIVRKDGAFGLLQVSIIHLPSNPQPGLMRAIVTRALTSLEHLADQFPEIDFAMIPGARNLALAAFIADGAVSDQRLDALVNFLHMLAAELEP